MFCIIGATDVTTQVPPLAVRVSAGSSRSPRITPKVQITESHISPAVSSPTAAMRLFERRVHVRGAERLACSRLNGIGSTAMIRRAPATRAPWIALMPMPPTPSTATVSPTVTCARLTAEPKPVATPQDTSATAVHGMSGSTLTTEASDSS